MQALQLIPVVVFFLILLAVAATYAVVAVLTSLHWHNRNRHREIACTKGLKNPWAPTLRDFEIFRVEFSIQT